MREELYSIENQTFRDYILFRFVFEIYDNNNNIERLTKSHVLLEPL